MRRHRRVEMAAIAEMNLTNLLDTAFVLVLALLMVAPMIKHGVQLQLPQTVADPGTLTTDPKTLTITIVPPELIGGMDQIRIEDQRWTAEEAATLVNERRRLDPKLDVILEVDRRTKSETFIKVIAALKSMGIENISIPTDVMEVHEREDAGKAAGAEK